jgi:hypothetical protein
MRHAINVKSDNQLTPNAPNSPRRKSKLKDAGPDGHASPHAEPAGQCHLAHDHDSQNSFKRSDEPSAPLKLGRWLIRSLLILAVVACPVLLAVGATPLLTGWSSHIAGASEQSWRFLKTIPWSAPPLLLIGCAYILLQAIVRPRPLELLQRLMLGCAFILWGITQLMPSNALSMELGNVVITLYVVDLALIIWSELGKTSAPRPQA